MISFSKKLTSLFATAVAGLTAFAATASADTMDMLSPANPASPINIAMRIANEPVTGDVVQVSPLTAAATVAGIAALAGGLAWIASKLPE